MVDSTRVSGEIRARRGLLSATAAAATSYLVLDTESVPDGELLQRVKYPGQGLTPDEAVHRARQEARELARDSSDFVPVTFHRPVAVCVMRVAADFSIQQLTCLDGPHFRPDEIVRQFWKGIDHYQRARLVTYNGRGFDLPLLELAAFENGLPARSYFSGSRNRYQGNHIDLQEFLSNFGAFRMTGGLDLLAKRLGHPGKLDVAGDQVYEMWQAGRVREINDYCMLDVLDTYFIFLRTRVLLGELTPEGEGRLHRQGRCWLANRAETAPTLARYLANWPERDAPITHLHLPDTEQVAPDQLATHITE